MLVVENLSKAYGSRVLFDHLSFTLPRTGRLAILGRNGQGKSTLIKILGGVLAPTSGRATWSMSASWPLGFAGAFQGSLTGMDNIRFVARIYGQPVDKIAQATEAFAELGEALTRQVKHYSSGMRARLAFGLSMAIEFECYLIDEVISVGDVAFQAKCHAELFDRRADRAFIIASHDMNFLRNTCERGIIIDAGRALVIDDINEAVETYVEIFHARARQEAAAGL